MFRRVRLSRIIIWEDIIRNLVDPKAKSVLDIGCEKGDPMKWINSKIKLKLRIATDLERDFLLNSLKENSHNAHIESDVRFTPFQNKSVDICLILGVLSYIEKKEALRALENAEKIAKKQVIVYTPIGRLPHQTDENFTKYGRWDEGGHVSNWTVKDFTKRGYEVKGVHGLRGLRNRKGKIRFNGILRIIFAFISYTSQILTYYNPNIAFEMVCIKKFNEPAKPVD